MLLNGAAQIEETALPVSLVCPRPNSKEKVKDKVVPVLN
jgi:hypothetical protein